MPSTTHTATTSAPGASRARNAAAQSRHAPWNPSTVASEDAEGEAPTPAPAAAEPSNKRLEAAIGDLASNYRVSPDFLEEAQLDLLNFFINEISNVHVRNQYKRRSKDNGANFIDIMITEIADDEVSMTVEDTVEMKMKEIVDGGFSEATWDCFTHVTGVYEEWNDTLDDKNFQDDRKRAHIYKKMLNRISTDVRLRLQSEISERVSKAATKGNDIQKEDPLGLLNSAASTVLNDLHNEAITQGMSQGRAFTAQGTFDARKTPERPTGGQTWSSGPPTKWIDTMRPCALCPDNTPEANKRHLDKECNNVPKATVDKYIKRMADQREERRKKRDEKKTGRAAVAKGKKSETEAKEAKEQDPFTEDKSSLVDLRSLFELEDKPPATKEGRVLMARAQTTCGDSTSSALTTVSAAESPKFYVFAGIEGDSSKECIGIYHGPWRDAVLPKLLDAHDRRVNKSAIKSATRSVPSLEAALASCNRFQIAATFLGPTLTGLPGLEIGDDVRIHLADSDNGSEPEEDDGDDDSEPEEDDGDDSSDPEEEDETDSEDASAPEECNECEEDDETDTEADAEVTPDSPLSQLVSRVEGLDSDVPLSALVDIIKEHSLNVSPGTGGKKKRTKLQMLQEIRAAVGCEPIVIKGLQSPTVETIPMGISVESPKGSDDKVRHVFGAARGHEKVRRRKQHAPSRPPKTEQRSRHFTCGGLLRTLSTLAFPVLLLGVLISASSYCPQYLPSDTCIVFGGGGIPTYGTPSLKLPAAAVAPKDPGATAVPEVGPPGHTTVPRSVPRGDPDDIRFAFAVASDVLPTILPILVMLATFFLGQAESPRRGRPSRTSPPRRGHSTTFLESRYHLLREAPPWVILALVAHDTAMHIIPNVAAIAVAFATLQPLFPPRRFYHMRDVIMNIPRACNTP